MNTMRKMDGSGPLKRFRQQIDPWARLISIANHYDHMRYTTKYGSPMGKEDAIEKLDAGAYSDAIRRGQHDPALLNVFWSYLKRAMNWKRENWNPGR